MGRGAMGGGGFGELRGAGRKRHVFKEGESRRKAVRKMKDRHWTRRKLGETFPGDRRLTLSVREGGQPFLGYCK